MFADPKAAGKRMALLERVAQAGSKATATLRGTLGGGLLRMEVLGVERYLSLGFPLREGEGVEEARFALHPPTFFRLLPELPEDFRIAPLDGMRVVLEGGRFRAELNALMADEAEGGPETPTVSGSLTLSRESLLQLLTLPAYAARHDHPTIPRALCLTRNEDRLEAAGTDGYRLALARIPLPEDAPESLTILLPSFWLSDLVRFLEVLEGEEVVLRYGEGWFSLAPADGDDLYWSPQMGNTFPRYQSVIPKDLPVRVRLDAERLSGALGRLAPLTDRENHRVDLTVEPGQVRLHVSGDYGEAWEEVPAEVEGQPLTHAFNLHYLLDAIKPIKGEAVLELPEAVAPSLVRPHEGPEYLAVVVPFKV